MVRPTAYSYARFSTPEQERGDSERRQIEAARVYAEQHGFVLDESIVVDRGVSAFAGKNVSEGALGEFIKREILLKALTTGRFNCCATHRLSVKPASIPSIRPSRWRG